jgi:hypothetical protein
MTTTRAPSQASSARLSSSRTSPQSLTVCSVVCGDTCRCFAIKGSLCNKIDPRAAASLHEHLLTNDVQYIHFAFRWMNCLLMREIPLRCTIRLWDTYLV